jgi:putative toxin-antitoxin system antitoxin component (TIGR02293 family)
MKDYSTSPSPSIEGAGAETSFVFPSPSTGGSQAETGYIAVFGAGTDYIGVSSDYIGGAGAKAHFVEAEAVALTGESGTTMSYGASGGGLVTFFRPDLGGTGLVTHPNIVTVEARSGLGGSLGTVVDGIFISAVIGASSDQDQIATMFKPAPSAEGEGTGPSLPEAARLALLDSAAFPKSAAVDPIRALEERSRDLAFEMLGGEAVLGRPVRSDEDLVQALMAGFPAQVLRSLQDAGYPHKVLEQVIAPRRTLMRRRAAKQRLTRAESDSAWRLAHVLVMASNILNGPQAAIAWLTRAKPAFGGQAPVDLLETSVGAAHVERLLKRLDWGDVA